MYHTNNQLPPYRDDIYDRRKVLAVKRAANLDKSCTTPKYLRRGLSFQELKHKIDKGGKFVVWKYGRTSQYTYGVAADIMSDYRLPNSLISAQLLIIDALDNSFSATGDSGSRVWDFQGHVCGLLYSGQGYNCATYVTPIEFVLEDIQKQCNAKEVKLVVRPEESGEPPEPLARQYSDTHSGTDSSDYEMIDADDVFF